MSPAMAAVTAQGLQIYSSFQLLLITKKMLMEGCPCSQKSRHWKGVLAFQEEYYKSKNLESFVSSYNELLHKGLQLFTPLSRSIVHDISSIHMRSSGSFRNAKSSKSQPNSAPIFPRQKPCHQLPSMSQTKTMVWSNPLHN